ncbi:MAG: DUF4089 domain-containing protein [Geitlerinemataceae cyanobacterium]
MNLEKIDWNQFVEQMSHAIDLPISPQSQPSVVENIKKIAEMTRLVTDFPLPESMEVAPKFRP